MNIPQNSNGLRQLVAIYRTLQGGQPKLNAIPVVRGEISYDEARETFLVQQERWVENLIAAGEVLQNFPSDITLRADDGKGGQADGCGNYWFRNLNNESARVKGAAKVVSDGLGGRKVVHQMAEEFLVSVRTDAKAPVQADA